MRSVPTSCLPSGSSPKPQSKNWGFLIFISTSKRISWFSFFPYKKYAIPFDQVKISW